MSILRTSVTFADPLSILGEVEPLRLAPDGAQVLSYPICNSAEVLNDKQVLAKFIHCNSASSMLKQSKDLDFDFIELADSYGLFPASSHDYVIPETCRFLYVYWYEPAAVAFMELRSSGAVIWATPVKDMYHLIPFRGGTVTVYNSGANMFVYYLYYLIAA